jgi:hypothetical protein
MRNVVKLYNRLCDGIDLINGAFTFPVLSDFEFEPFLAKFKTLAETKEPKKTRTGIFCKGSEGYDKV